MRLIDADAVVEHLFKDEDYESCNNYYIEGIRDAIRTIDNAPTVDPVKHGYWVHTRIMDSSDENVELLACSRCKSHIWLNTFEECEYPYCPYCGAKNG